jgi:hypothetical protein
MSRKTRTGWNGWTTGVILTAALAASAGGCVQATYPHPDDILGPRAARSEEEKENKRLRKAVEKAREEERDLLKKQQELREDIAKLERKRGR